MHRHRNIRFGTHADNNSNTLPVWLSRAGKTRDVKTIDRHTLSISESIHGQRRIAESHARPAACEPLSNNWRQRKQICLKYGTVQVTWNSKLTVSCSAAMLDQPHQLQTETATETPTQARPAAYIEPTILRLVNYAKAEDTMSTHVVAISCCASAMQTSALLSPVFV